ncbi:MAG TPA: FG-GAP repeat protein, partial [Methylomirabilota bacterium]|nr:FG-GAP repeat protein [Methylomirabilota bacterium]
MRRTRLFAVAALLCPATLISILELGAATPLQIAQQAYLKASNTMEDDQFGYAVAISGDTMVVGAWASYFGAGTAYVFVRTGESWIEQTYLQPGSLDFFAFGTSVAICTNTIVIGARVAAPPGDPVPWVDGAAFVYVRDGTNWSQQTILQPSNLRNNFGISVSVCGDIAVVGADRDSTNGFDSGAAYVFVRTGTNWTEEAYLHASNADPGDRFGMSVSVSGETVVVGAYGEDSSATGVNGSQGNNIGFGDSGAAYVFTRSGTTWPQQAYLKASDTSIDDLFGHSVAVSGNTAVIGARGEASNATGVQNTSQRTAEQDDDHAPEAGAAYVFVRTGTNWSQQAYLKASNAEHSDYFGSSVAVSGDTVVVGAFGEDSNASGVNGNQSNDSEPSAGAAYVFVRDGAGTWQQQAYLKASNTDTNDFFGWAVAVAENTIVAGAYAEDGTALESGAAYVFHASPPANSGYASIPNPSQRIDFGLVEDTRYRRLYISNVGTNNLQIQSITALGGHDLKIYTGRSDVDSGNSTFSTGGGVTLPYTLPPNATHSLLVFIHWEALEEPLESRELEASLEVISNDPVFPLVGYALVGIREDALENTLEIVIIEALNRVAPLPNRLAGQRSRAVGASSLMENETATFSLEPGAPCSLMTEIPSFLGGGTVTLSNFTGSVTVSLQPIPNDTNRALLRIESGSFTAPSFRLPSGLESGLNRLTFGPPEQSEGVLLLTNGNYTASATATIFNDL